MTSDESARVAGPAPRQARGRERRESIIDAAGQIVAAQGADALTLHTAARQAGSSIGSMYHFFQGRDELLEALRQRHRVAVAVMTQEAGAIPLERWRAMSTREVIDRLFGPSVDYFGQHRDALVLVRLDDNAVAAEFQALLGAIMAARLGEAAGARAAATLFAVCTGTQFFLRDVHFEGEDAARSEIPRVLSAYLEELEHEAAGRN